MAISSGFNGRVIGAINEIRVDLRIRMHAEFEFVGSYRFQDACDLVECDVLMQVSQLPNGVNDELAL